MKLENNGPCLLCGAPLQYVQEAVELECAICHRSVESHTFCENGHFICDMCHGAPGAAAVRYVALHTKEEDPILVAEEMMAHEAVHMHGPEHHILIGAALLTAYHNRGGELDLAQALHEMERRGSAVPGGACGFWGACGAAISTGMALSILTKCTPYETAVWGRCNDLTGDCLKAIGQVGGPRCCKRNGFLCIQTAVPVIQEVTGVALPRAKQISCTHFPHNRECLKTKCPYFPANAFHG